MSEDEITLDEDFLKKFTNAMLVSGIGSLIGWFIIAVIGPVITGFDARSCFQVANIFLIGAFTLGLIMLMRRKG